MEELVEIIINLIAGFMKNNAQKRTQQPKTAPPPLPGNAQNRSVKVVRSDLSNRAVVTANMPSAARKKVVGRRARLPAIAMARPIVTNTAPAPAATPAPVPVKAVAAKQIVPASKSTTVALTAVSFNKWLNPKTLQQQFMMTEIFQPRWRFVNRSSGDFCRLRFGKLENIGWLPGQFANRALSFAKQQAANQNCVSISAIKTALSS